MRPGLPRSNRAARVGTLLFTVLTTLSGIAACYADECATQEGRAITSLPELSAVAQAMLARLVPPPPPELLSLEIDGEWSLIPPGTLQPPPRWFHSAIYNPDLNQMIVFGGKAALGGTAALDDLWLLSLSMNPPQWTQVPKSGLWPSARWGHSAIYAADHQVMVTFGGDLGGTQVKDTWTLDAAYHWGTRPGGPAGMDGRDGHSAIYDAVGDRMIVFGGGPQLHNDVWAYSLDPPAWSQITPAGTPPSGRTLHSAIYDPVRRNMVVFGGGSSGANDVWSLSLGNVPRWTQITPSGSLPPIRTGHVAVYEPIQQRMVTFGGSVGLSLFRSDTWSLPLATPDPWLELQPSGTIPSGRTGLSGVYYPVAKRMLSFGGDASDVILNECWQLAWGDAPPPGGSCPYLFRWDGCSLTIDNNLLPASEFLSEPGIHTDHYKIMGPLARTGSGYELEIRELEEDHSELDAVRLQRVIHPEGTRIAVDAEGDPVLLTDLLYAATAIDNGGGDHVPGLSVRDGVKDTFDAGDSLVLTFSAPPDSTWRVGPGRPLYLLLVADQKPPPCEAPCEGSIIVQIEDRSGRWHDVDVVHPRALWEDLLVNVTPPTALHSPFRIRLVWTQTHSLDMVALVPPGREELIAHRLALSTATHSAQGDVAGQIGHRDEWCVPLDGGEAIGLVFEPGEELPPGADASFILSTSGYYVLAGSRPLPPAFPPETRLDVSTRTTLHVSPNPLHAGERVEIDLTGKSSRSGEVSVFDVAGRRVWHHSVTGVQADNPVEWSGRDAAGRPVSAGVYFVRFAGPHEATCLRMVVLP